MKIYICLVDYGKAFHSKDHTVACAMLRSYDAYRKATKHPEGYQLTCSRSSSSVIAAACGKLVGDGQGNDARSDTSDILHQRSRFEYGWNQAEL